MNLSFVIPCYRSERSIAAVADEIVAAMAARGERSFEIILVNDFSPDGTAAEIERLALQHDFVQGIFLSRNFGQHAALLCGLRAAAGDVVVCLDDDGQTPADEVDKLLAALERGADVAFARYAAKRHTGFRNFGSRLNDRMAEWLLRKPKGLYLSSYFAARRFVIDEVCRYGGPYPYMSGLLLRATGNIVNIDVHHRDRTAGASGYTLHKLISLWLNGFTNFSVKPLRVVTVMGSLFAVGGFLFGLYVILQRLLIPGIQIGWSSMIAAITFMGGMILLVLGMVGEYIGRMFITMGAMPQYVVARRTGEEKPRE